MPDCYSPLSAIISDTEKISDGIIICGKALVEGRHIHLKLWTRAFDNNENDVVDKAMILLA